MTHPTYTSSTLGSLPTAQLKTIARSIGAIPDGDKRSKQVWSDAIIQHQTAFSPVKVAAMEAHIELVTNRMESIPFDADETPATVDEAFCPCPVDRQVVAKSDNLDNYMPTPHTHADDEFGHLLFKTGTVPTPHTHADDEAFAAAMGLTYDDVFGSTLGSSEWEEIQSLEPNTQSLEPTPQVSAQATPSQQKGASIVAVALVLAFGMAILIIKLGFTSIAWIIAALLPLALGLWQYLVPTTKQQASIDYFPQN